MLFRIATALLLAGVACAVSEELEDDGPSLLDVQVLSAALCELPRETEGPCAFACAQDELFKQFIPESYCVTFNCTHMDGRPYLVGGCNF